MDDLMWEDMFPPVNDEHIRHIEGHLGVRFPHDYRECAKRYHGGYPLISSFDYIDPYLGVVGTGLGELFNFDLDDRWNILWQNQSPPESLPQGLVMIGQDGGGGYICLDYRSGEESPRIAFWRSNAPSADTVIHLADTFTEFIGMLHEPRDLDSAV